MTPKGIFLGLNVNGRTVSFAENAFYEFKHSKIASVWSVIDKAAIETQLRGVTGRRSRERRLLGASADGKRLAA